MLHHLDIIVLTSTGLLLLFTASLVTFLDASTKSRTSAGPSASVLCTCTIWFATLGALWLLLHCH
jgi:hypothetical protein